MNPSEPKPDAVVIYHRVQGHEDFKTAALAIYRLVQEAERTHPGQPRKLVVDIFGHRNGRGGFDADMLELQKQFMGFMMMYLTELQVPLYAAKNVKQQKNNIPERLDVLENRG